MKRPNIVLISLDTVRADHLSCYGYARSMTPNIDALASEGTIYRRNFSTGVWTPPGHASMLTGLYVSEHGVYDTKKLADEIPTIATTLKESGYQTAGFVCNSQVGELVGFDKGHDRFVEVWKGLETTSITEKIAKGLARRLREKRGFADMGARHTNAGLKNWIERHIEKDEPFYAFLHYIEAHNPLAPPRPFNIEYPKGMDIERVKKVAHNPLICFIEDLPLTDEEVRLIIDLYDAEIRYLDATIRGVVDMLKANGLYDNTMIIITADHGEHFGEYDLWSHVASLYREVLNIPLIIKYPAGVPHLSEVTAYTQLVDIYPTVMEIAGVGAEKGNAVSGKSLVQRDGAEAFHDYVFAEWEGRVPYFIQRNSRGDKNAVDIEALKVQMSMAQDRSHKLIVKSNGDELLFDVSEGTDKPCDIAGNEAVRDRLREEVIKRSKAFEIGGKDERKVNKEIEENLKALGYL